MRAALGGEPINGVGDAVLEIVVAGDARLVAPVPRPQARFERQDPDQEVASRRVRAASVRGRAARRTPATTACPSTTALMLAVVASIESTVVDVLDTADRLKAAGAAGNEANTKALLIEPVVSALGWNLFDIGEVDREFRVYDGTFLDYALRVDGNPRLFLEAKALSKSLNDKPFIAQTVNYANNEGVLWCVLTNGLDYRVYKSNEPVDMERKLLFEVDLREAADEHARANVVAALRKLSRQAVEAGELDAWGEEIFTDVRTRAALARLGVNPSVGFIRAVGAALDGPAIEPPRLKSSLARILGQVAPAAVQVPVVGKVPRKQKGSGPEPAPAKTAYDIEHHKRSKPSAIIDLFDRVDAYATALGPDVSRRVRKFYVGYFAGKRSFFTCELQKAKIYVYLSLDPPAAQPWDEEVMRDVTNIGHFGMGNTEFVLRLPEQLPAVEELIKQSYLKNRT